MCNRGMCNRSVGGKCQERMGFLTACGMQLHSFLNLAIKENMILLCFVWSVDY